MSRPLRPTRLQIKDQQLSVQLADSTATVTVTFTVVLLAHDLSVRGGFLETVTLTGPLAVAAVPKKGSLPIPDNAQAPLQLPRSHTFKVPRHPAGPLTTVRFAADIEVWPAVKVHDEKLTNQGVLPARYPLLSAIADVVRAVTRRLRYLIVGR
jgi:hypothetical protein